MKNALEILKICNFFSIQ